MQKVFSFGMNIFNSFWGEPFLLCFHPFETDSVTCLKLNYLGFHFHRLSFLPPSIL